ncbi:MAG TPA: hypothetical protein VFG63_14840 [Nocardioidaceae bacterium]|nr:hypothetical protein [Nocardioidaceae bacterium]
MDPHGHARRFTFRFTPAYRLAGRLFGITEHTAEVVLSDDALHARFGHWAVSTSLDNIASTHATGPYRFLKTAGPAHLSFADRGLTFATNGDLGICLAFREPVPGIEPTGRLRHPNLTLTVTDCDGLAAALRS